MPHFRSVYIVDSFKSSQSLPAFSQCMLIRAESGDRADTCRNSAGHRDWKRQHAGWDHAGREGEGGGFIINCMPADSLLTACCPLLLPPVVASPLMLLFFLATSQLLESSLCLTFHFCPREKREERERRSRQRKTKKKWKMAAKPDDAMDATAHGQTHADKVKCSHVSMAVCVCVCVCNCVCVCDGHMRQSTRLNYKMSITITNEID